MKHEPDILEQPDEAAEAAADARGMADDKAGRVVSHAAMREWLLSWGRGEKRPLPQLAG